MSAFKWMQWLAAVIFAGIAAVGMVTSSKFAGPAILAAYFCLIVVMLSSFKKDSHHAGQLALILALPLFGVDYFTSFFYASGEMLHALEPFGLQKWAFLGTAFIAVVNFTFGAVYLYSLGVFRDGGGSYTAAMRRLYPVVALLAAIFLIVDYILTIVVSNLSGVDQILSIVGQYQAAPIFHIGLGLLFTTVVWFITISGRGESGKIVFILLSLFVLLTGTMAVGLFVAIGKVPAAVSPQIVPPSLFETLGHFIAASMKGIVALTGLEAVSNGIQFFKDEDPSFVAWGKKNLPRLQKLWSFYSGKSGIARVVQTSFLFYGSLTTLFLVGFAIHFNVFDGTNGRTLVGNLAYIGFTQIPGGQILFGAYLFLGVALLIAASLTALQDCQATEWRDSGIGIIPEFIVYRDPKGTFTRSVTISAILAGIIMIMVSGETTHAIPYYGIGVFFPITVMSLAMRKHAQLTMEKGFKKFLAMRGLEFSSFLGAIVFLGQIFSKWAEGGYMVLVIFICISALMHLILISPLGKRNQEQLARIVYEKARVRGEMAKIVIWQSLQMMGYRRWLRSFLGLSDDNLETRSPGPFDTFSVKYAAQIPQLGNAGAMAFADPEMLDEEDE